MGILSALAYAKTAWLRESGMSRCRDCSCGAPWVPPGCPSATVPPRGVRERAALGMSSSGLPLDRFGGFAGLPQLLDHGVGSKLFHDTLDVAVDVTR